MSIFDSAILGLIQGLAEFVPISSSGHLIIARDLFGWHGSSDLTFDAVLQLATGLALVIYFWKDIVRLLRSFLNLITKKVVDGTDKILIYAIILGTIPGVIFGLLLEKYMNTVFRSAILVSVVLVIGSAVMYFAEKVGKMNGRLSVKKGFLVGLFQCLALVPGFSRSGATISGGLFMGLTREDAARFSFLLSIPIVLGSGFKKLLEMWSSGGFNTNGINVLVGSIVAFIVGLLAIDFLMKYLKNHSLKPFIIYRIVLAAVVLAVLL